MPGKLLVICENSNSLTEGYISVQARSLKRNGWDVVFLCCSEFSDVDNENYQLENFRVECVPSFKPNKPKNMLERFKKIIRTVYHKNSELVSQGEIFQWEKKIKSISPDSILIQFGTMAAKILPALEKFPGQWVVHFHGFDITERCEHWGYRVTLRNLMNIAPKVVGCSKFVLSNLTKYTKNKERLYLITPGYDEVRYQYSREKDDSKKFQPVRIISVARLAEGKGHDITLRALSHLKVSWTLTVIGEGPEKSMLVELAKNLNIESNVVFMGAQSSDVILEKLYNSDIFVQSSRRSKTGWVEGLGLSVLEASATGLPVIVSDSGGLNETCLHNETGIIYAEENLDELIIALNKLCIGSDLRERMGSAGANWVKEKYSSKVQSKKLSKILLGLNYDVNE